MHLSVFIELPYNKEKRNSDCDSENNDQTILSQRTLYWWHIF